MDERLMLETINIKLPDKVEDGYPFCLPVVMNFETIHFTNRISIFIGENGVGKSTLLEAIAVRKGFNCEGGNKDIFFEGYKSISQLAEYMTIYATTNHIKHGFYLKPQTLYNFNMEVYEAYGGTEYCMKSNPLDKSHGEGILEIIKKYFRENGLYILDEPETALSPLSQFIFLNTIHDMSRNLNCQFIIATHSPIIAGYPYADLHEIAASGEIKKTTYTQSSLYTLYTRYLLDEQYRYTLVD